MSVLVTGALGAIGSWVVRRLIEQEAPFTAMDWRADFSLLPDLEGQFEFVEGDILDREALGRLVRERGVRRILHLAALMPPACEQDPLRGYQVNFLGALNVFDVARELGLERVVFMSSKARYGAVTGRHLPPTFKPITEDYEGQPLDVYGSTKLALEDAARHYRRLCSLDLITLRLGTTYGPGKLARHGVVGLKSRIVEMAFHGQPMVVSNPDYADDAVYNRDVAKAIVLACSAPQREHWQFNVSGGQLVTLRQFTQEVMRLCPRHQLTFDESPAEPPKTAGLLSGARARAELGFQPDFPGLTGIADYVAHLERLAPAAPL
ncbi:MAG TPA: NAD(P)-dependent oxidoreductase [Chloroflexota bacterium]|nr:NAD(P)-dependent oxidoreductase [Chloroflexota bacterium]